MKPVRLSPSEKANAEIPYDGNEDRTYTIIRRPQEDGRYWIAAVRLKDGKVITDEFAENKQDVRRAVREVNRWMDKAFGGGPMSDKSRHRSKNSREDRIATRLVRAGDEWIDFQTEDFAKEVVKVMNSDRAVGKATARHNKIYFDFSPTILSSIPLVLELREFGYDGHSESVNGDITSPENGSFRLPGGFTRDRDPKGLWKRAKANLIDIFQRALVR